MKIFDDIKEFHEKFGLEYKGKPRIVDPGVSLFRAQFGREEIQEYQDSNDVSWWGLDTASQDEYTQDLSNILDALVDQMYVLAGTVYLHGMVDQFEEAWNRVHKANMAKVRAANAKESKRGSSLDVVKPEGWTPPCHKDLVRDNDWT